jgi:WD40 repeat protein
MEYSLDGKHLASGITDESIRIWRAESFHATFSSKTPIRTPKQADTILVGSRSVSTALSFSRTDSNILASGGFNGEIKVWNIKEKSCIHSFNPRRGLIRSLCFAGGSDSGCIALTYDTSIIRLWRSEGSLDFASETIGGADQGGTGLATAALSPSGSFLAAVSTSRIGNGYGATLALIGIETMTKTQSVVMPGHITTCIWLSPDSKQLVYGGHKGRIHLLQTDDLSIQRDLDTTGEATAVCSVAFDPTCRVLAVGCDDGRLDLRSL